MLVPSINLFTNLNAVFPDKICKLTTFDLIFFKRSNADTGYITSKALVSINWCLSVIILDVMSFSEYLLLVHRTASSSWYVLTFHVLVSTGSTIHIQINVNIIDVIHVFVRFLRFLFTFFFFVFVFF